MNKQIVLLSLLLCIMFTGSAMAGLVAYWPLNEGSGQIVADASGNGNDGVLGDASSVETSDPVWVVDSVHGNVLQLAGAGNPQWVNLDAHIASFSGLNQGSILAWIKTPPTSANVVLAASDSGDGSSEMRFFHDPSYGGIPGIRYDVREGGDTYFQISSYPTDPGDDTWHHVAVTVDAEGAVGLYVDGVLASTGQEIGFFSAVADVDSMSLGRNVDSGGPQWFFEGLMSEVSVFNEPLAGSAVAAIYGGLDVASISQAVWGGTPADGATHVEVPVTISWEQPEDAIDPTYNVYIGTDPNTMAAVSTGQSETTFITGQLDPATKYYWAVDTISNGTEYPGGLSSFITAGGISDPMPADGTVDVDTYVNLSWTGDASITSYDVYLGTTAGSLSLQGNVGEASYDLPELNDFTEYFWRVDAKDAGNAVITAGEVLSFSTGGIIAHWDLDEGSGIFADDSVGSIDGDVVDANWIDGIIPESGGTSVGSALVLGGAGWVDLGDPDLIEGRTSMTLSTWIRLDGPPVNGARLVEHEDVLYYYIRGTKFAYENHGYGRVVSTTEPVPGNWYHVLVTFDGDSQDMYVNGVLEASSGGVGMRTSIYPMHIGCRRSAGGDPSNFFNGSVDDIRVFSNKFSAEGVLELYANSSLAKNPSPAEGENNVAIDTSLSWDGGVNAVTHNVYLGTSYDENGVIAIDSAEGISGTTFDPFVDLDLNTTYYWQVNEVNGTGAVTKGNIWSFVTVPPKAYDPIPADEAVEVDPAVVLEWTAGAGGTYTHNVYFGTDPLAMELVSESQVDTVLDPLGIDDLAWNTKYYWAVDELENGSVYEGDLWSFTTINPVCETPLAGDIDGDCMVTLSDLAIMASDWLKCNLIPVEACQ